ncbi:MAG: hypothetical protein WD894_10485 [Pirellulales bacterium]
MAENESLDLGAAYSQRWDKLFSAIRKDASCGEVAAEVRKALYGGVNKARKQFREYGAPLADFLAARASRRQLRQLVRKTEGHEYAQLFESSAHASGAASEDCIRGWMEAILDRVIDQICLRVAGTENWPTIFDVKAFTDDIGRVLADDVERIATKLAQDPNCRLTVQRQEATKPSRNGPTEELLGVSLLGGPK